ncbi:hypothetical protein [Streptococcus thoraltensis]|uniref:hypothetical protein n=1 Tax=Streptococcus thoraltensis TaxID=55085 RepID=UPI001F597748|nr:hypothetical protein [Streptococcus thoraltensis]
MEKNGLSFLTALGFFILAVSPTFGNKYYNIITGFLLIFLGFYLMKKRKNKIDKGK